VSVKITVHAHPKSSRNRLEMKGDEIHIYTTALPAENQANQSIQEILAKALGVPKTSLSLEKGHTSKAKIFEHPTLTEHEVRSKLGLDPV
jgi:uncharacterized protein